MDTNKMKSIKQETRVETSRWKLAEFRKNMVKRLTDLLMERGGPSDKLSLSDIIKCVEGFEEKINTSAKNEAEYIALVSAKVKAIYSLPPKGSGYKILLSNPSGSGKDANKDWQEQVYEKIQKMRKYHTVLISLYQKLTSEIQQHESSPQEPKVNDMARLKYNKKALQSVFSLFGVMNKSQITIDIKGRVDKAEAYVHNLLKHVSSYQQAKHSSDVQSKQNTQEQQVQAPGIPASPLIKDNNNLNEISQNPTLVSEEPCAAMQRLIEVLNSMSPEALSAAIGEIVEVVILNDAMMIDEPPEMAQQQEEQPSLIPEGRKMSRSIDAMTYDIASIIFDGSLDSFNQFTDVEEPDLDSATSEVNRPRIEENRILLEEIEEINDWLMDGEIVICEKENIESAAGGATEHSKGLVVKFMYNAVTVNQDLVSHFAVDRKSMIKPLWLVVPASYPFSSPVILDHMPLEVSGEVRDVSGRARAKLRMCVQRLNEPWSLKDMAKSWERCAREAILDYAHSLGGGTFSSSTFGGAGWENC